ncbi:2Fe-2S iron-sulfur cluster-binding protein [Zavarzinia compransoris]|uniref:Oxidoreductase n=1 Tax=Zavarzinia compransoris TaxID=1264899 RepID=A0A317DTE2_9PROT|nr:2Fe-2S iron-sulfur cluster-binding protein [Zavarzinia compransoris]PWR17958.1 oxidoreductase [Zavarzinia compransoris]TDP40068.1 toluene monooxygenase electron transfer component [Zavarzinia compransoris]
MTAASALQGQAADDRAAVVTVEGGGSFVQGAGDASLLQAALRGGLGLPYECSSGGCGSCRIQVVEGEVESLWPEAPGLSPRDRRKGLQLACQTRACGNATIKVTLDGHCVPKVPPRVMHLTLVSARDLTRDIREFRFAAPGPAEFIAGQYAILRLPDGLRRCYSMSNLPNAEGYWEFQIKRVPGGKASNGLFDMAPGAVIGLDGPYGLAHLVAESARPVVCIAGGSGLAPMVSIARAVGADPARQLDFFYGGRTAADVCGEAHLAGLPGFGDTLRYHPVVSSLDDPLSAGWTGLSGFVHEVVGRHQGDRLREAEIYFAGPPPMAEALQRLLMLDLKVPFGQIHYDRFF